MLIVFYGKLLLAMFVVSVRSCKYGKYGRNDDKLVLDPVELIDLVLEEQRGQTEGMPLAQTQSQADSTLNIKTTTMGIEIILKAENALKSRKNGLNYEEALKGRKVWSRWSKWSDCSVTCGSGVLKRRRACVEGRCATGEYEEQLRPCDRVPCLQRTDDDLLDQFHDTD